MKTYEEVIYEQARDSYHRDDQYPRHAHVVAFTFGVPLWQVERDIYNMFDKVREDEDRPNFTDIEKDTMYWYLDWLGDKFNGQVCNDFFFPDGTPEDQKQALIENVKRQQVEDVGVLEDEAEVSDTTVLYYLVQKLKPFLEGYNDKIC